MPINCSHCHAYCCRVIGKLDPSLDRGDLVCKHLTQDNKCDIYENRPLICNTDRMYTTLYKDIMTREEYDAVNAQGCAALSNYFENNELKGKE